MDLLYDLLLLDACYADGFHGGRVCVSSLLNPVLRSMPETAQVLEGARETARWVKCLPSKLVNLSLIPSLHVKSHVWWWAHQPAGVA